MDLHGFAAPVLRIAKKKENIEKGLQETHTQNIEDTTSMLTDACGTFPGTSVAFSAVRNKRLCPTAGEKNAMMRNRPARSLL